MNYDCHLEVSCLTPRKTVSDYLSRSKPSGVVYVQKGADHRSRCEWIDHMNGLSGSCGVAMVNPYDSQDGFSQLASLGVCGARFAENGPTSLRSIQEQLVDLHVALPANWHIEFESTWTTAGLLAPLLARMGRIFCLTPRNAKSDASDAALQKVLWWLDMGNAYVKFTCARMEQCRDQIYKQVCRSTPDRVVVGSGEPTPYVEALWMNEDFISPEQADSNAQRLYPFFRARQIH